MPQSNSSAYGKTDLFTASRLPIPPEGTLLRCQHSVYMPPVDEPTGRSHSCGLCREMDFHAPTGGFSMPRRCSTDLRRDETTKGNRHEPGVCPCGSRIHYETEKPSEWLCADCGTTFLAAKRRHAGELVVA